MSEPLAPMSCLPKLSWCVLVVVVSLLAACSGGRDKLLVELQSPRPDERATAVKKLAERPAAEDLVLFAQAAKDPVAFVRTEAAAALGKSNDPQVVDLLGELLSDPDETVQAKAASALAQMGNEKSRGYLMLQYGRRGRATRQAIVKALTQVNVPGAMAAAVAVEAKNTWERNLQTLTDGSLPERVGAAEELGKSGRAEAVNRLVPLLKESQVILVAAAVRGLGNANDKRAVGPISELLKESYPQLREAACDALIQLKDEAALPRLLEVAKEKSPASPFAVAAAAALPQSPETDKVLCDIALSAAPDDAMAAGQEQRERGGCPIEPIADKLKNQSTIPAALVALASLGPTAKDAAPKVLPLLTQSDAEVRRLAVEALAQMKDESAAPAVLKAYEAEVKALEPHRADWVTTPLPLKFGPGFDPNEPVNPNDPDASLRTKQQDLFRRVRALNQARLAEANRITLNVVAPAEVIDDTDDDKLRVLAALVRALGALKVENAKTLIEPWRKESSPSLRAAAYRGLAALGPDTLPLVRDGLLDSERTVQIAAADALAQAGEPGQLMILDVLGQLTGDRSRLLEPLRELTLPKAAVPTLLQLVKEGGAEAGPAALLVGRIGANEALEPLLKELDDPSAVARREILLGVGMLKDARAIDTVAKDLYSESADVRAAAAEALATLGPGRHADALLALKVDYYRKVRESAQTALAKHGEH